MEAIMSDIVFAVVTWSMIGIIALLIVLDD